jgi:integrase
MFAEYRATTDRLVGAFGKARRVEDLAPEDFGSLRAGMAKQFGPVRLGNEVQRVRTVFKYAVDNGLTEKVIRYGSEFRKPDKRVLRRHRAAAGKKTLSADELRRVIAAAGVPLRAMILLGVNCGFGNNDCATLPLSALDLDGGWVEFPRPKTGIARRCPLWPESADALRAAIAARPEPKDDTAAGQVFVTRFGRSWSADGTAVAHEVGKLLRRLGLSRPRVGFYALRHTFRTVADATRDPNAIRLIMGHTDDAIDDAYTHGIDDTRLRAVADHVRDWLFGSPDGTAATPPGDTSTPANPEEDADGTQGGEPVPQTSARPVLRLYAG